jgi:penicillin-binding protein 1B
VAAGLLVLLVGLGVFTYYYVRFARIIDARLSGDVFANASVVYAAPHEIRVGEAATPAAIAARLRKAFYAEGKGGSNVGTYKLVGERLEIYPGPTSFFQGNQIQEGPATLVFKAGQIASITTLGRHPTPLENYWLEPAVITTVFDRGRSKRLLIRYQDIPKVLVDAILAAEDHRFFSHFGVSIYRVLGAGIADLRGDHGLQGGSTLTMQLAREFFLNRDRTWSVKVKQACLALMLEQRLSKEQIFEMYSNQIYLGQRGSFSVDGFGEAASAYFNKDVGSLTLPEAALLAGLIRGPNLYSPYKYPDRALERRNYVLRRMAEVGFITPPEAEKAVAEPLGLAQRNVEGSQAPFFVDMVRDQLLDRFSEKDLLSQSYRIYTSLDMDLQEAASEAARSGIAEVDEDLKKRHRKGAPPIPRNQPQLAMVVLDPQTGVVKALVGGRNYAVSQLNHALARRQPGSSFKPFVYAAALASGVDGSQPLITPATILKDEPTTFDFADQPYEPGNYMQEYHGDVTLRQALMLSMNVATVSLAEMVGYGKVRDLAIAAGINKDIGSTPALALGAYVATPVEIAGAYTIFSNQGKYVAPRFILEVNDSSGHTLWNNPPVTRQVLDPRVSYLMVNLMQSVINNGTGYPARARGFKLPAAGKTGTSHDGWFAGFTSNLLAVAWVGYDDNRELKLEGAHSALPIWTDFMKAATALPAYRDVKDFKAPSGIVTATIDSDSNLVATVNSISTHTEIFIEGTEPTVAGTGEMAPGMAGNQGGQPSGISKILSEILHGGKSHAEPAPVVPPAAASTTPGGPATDTSADPATQAKHKGVLGKIISVFKGKSQTPPSQPTPPPKKPDSQ